VLAYWANFNNCDPDPIITEIPDIAPNDGSTVEHHLYPNGDRGVTVEHFKVLGGGHTWPGTELGGSTTNYDIDASEEIWNFFSRYDIDGLINISSAGEELTAAKEPTIYPNPCNSSVTVELKTADTRNYELLGLDGSLLQSGTVRHSLKIDLTGLPTGMYLLKLGDRMFKIVKTG
jgi:polyhydroxybutyrate depolymerase